MKKWNCIMSGLGFCIFLGLLVFYNTRPIHLIDKTIYAILRDNEVLIAFHYVGNTSVILTVLIILLTVLWFKQKQYRAMFFVLITIVGGKIVNLFLKNIVERPRPEIVDQLTTFSFPSAHAMLSLLYLFTVAYLISKIGTHKLTLLVWLVAILFTFLIGLSRVAENRHFASDIIAGWSIGYCWFVICVTWYEQRRRKVNIIQGNT